MLCPLCNQQTPDVSKFCEHCGKKIPRCPTCGKVIREKMRFCDADGTPIPEELTAHIPVQAQPAAPVRPAPVQASPVAPVQPPVAPAPVQAQPVHQQPPVRRQFCTKCGKPCEPGQDLCNDCMEPEEEAVVPAKKKGGKGFVIFLLVLILAAALVAAYYLLGEGNDADDDSEGEGSGVVQEDPNGEDKPAMGDNSQAVDSTAPATEPAEVTEPPVRYEYRYEVIKSDMSWTEAQEACKAKGGYLATIGSQEEYETICKLADESGLTYLWLGANLPSENADWANIGWSTGEAWTFENWYPGEPSKVDADGTKELYLCMWDAKYSGRDIGWTFNDQRNDIVADFPSISGILGYVCEYKVEVRG